MKGIRVVRGKDWSHDDQDGGEGHVGTAEIKPSSPIRIGGDIDGVVNVKWDIGSKGDYRAGHESKKELRIYDNAQAGVIHNRARCSGCGEAGIKGMLWICDVCPDVCLCTACYHGDKHDTTHKFYRKNDSQTAAEDVGKRQGTRKIRSRGLFPGCKVLSGFDKEEDDDGGTILSILSSPPTSYNSFARVKWEDTAQTTDHSIAHGGKLELMCQDDEGHEGPAIYMDHLPHLDTSTGEPEPDLAENMAGANLNDMLTVLLKSLKPAKKREPCKTMDRCEAYFKTLSLEEEFRDSDRDMCLCKPCVKKRGDTVVQYIGQPKAKFVLPVGWCSFGLVPPPHAKAQKADDKWHRAFHGTPAYNVVKILTTGELLMPCDVTPDGHTLQPPPGHFTEGNKPKDFDIMKIFLSPSILYSGCGAYAKPVGYRDPSTNRLCPAKTVLEVLLKPDSYDKGPETVGARSQRRQIDPEYDNMELEWMTRRRGVVIPIALLVKLD